MFYALVALTSFCSSRWTAGDYGIQVTFNIIILSEVVVLNLLFSAGLVAVLRSLEKPLRAERR
jgi:hypothetical protein